MHWIAVSITPMALWALAVAFCVRRAKRLMTQQASERDNRLADKLTAALREQRIR